MGLNHSLREPYLSLLAACLALGACSKDPLGGPCADDEEDVYKVMRPKDGDNFVAQDPTLFLNCETFICLSTNGSKPYCTRRCASDAECANSNDVAMECKVVTEFGPLACANPQHEFCDEEACLQSCASAQDRTACEKECREQLCCERDPETQAVKNPAKYCAARDGEIPHDPRAEPRGGAGGT